MSPAIAGRVIRLSTPARYSVAVAAAILAIAVRLALDPVWGVRLPYITLFPAIMVAAWLGGLWPGILTTLISGAAAQYFWVEPAYSWKVTEPSELLGLIVFLGVGVVISVLNDAWRSSSAALSASEERLTATLTDLEAALHARDDFLSVASHELRNPVNAVQLQLVGVLREIERGGHALDSEWLGHRIGQAHGQVKRLTRLIDNLLDVSRITAGALVLEPERVDFRDVVRTAVDHFRDELKPDQAVLQMPGEPVPGHWDPVRLDQVVTNLLSNAIKYGNGKPIELSLRAERDAIRFSVADRGIGIEPDKQQRLFAPFERAVSGRQYGGFGLGLWITKRVVEAMRGTIAVESRPGKGSTFVVVLPRGSVEETG